LIWKSVEEDLASLVPWLLSRVWPRRYSDLEKAFENYLNVLNDFLKTFKKYAVPINDSLEIERFYKIKEWDEARYHMLVGRYEFHVDLVADLILELTRAANYICDRTREFLIKKYRLDQGVLLVESGPNSSLEYSLVRPEYKDDEKIDKPYPSLTEFMTLRASRSYHFGAGVEEEG
jgi:hypothetical protein